MTAEFLIRALGGHGGMALCPAHDDRTPSLHITQKHHRVLFKCFAGCTQQAVIEALKARGLWNSCAKVPQTARIVASYNYTDQCGELLYQVVRKEPKAFLQRYPNGRGGWIWKKHPNQVLYRLPEVLEAPIVFITEGEKDVETLRDYGFVATTNAGGAKAPWLPQFTEVVRARECILIPDNDPPGCRSVGQTRPRREGKSESWWENSAGSGDPPASVAQIEDAHRCPICKLGQLIVIEVLSAEPSAVPDTS